MMSKEISPPMHMATLDRGWARVKYGKGTGSDGLGDDAGGGAMDGNGEGRVRECAAECAGTSQGDLPPIAWANAGLALWLRGTCVAKPQCDTEKAEQKANEKLPVLPLTAAFHTALKVGCGQICIGVMSGFGARILRRERW